MRKVISRNNGTRGYELVAASIRERNLNVRNYRGKKIYLTVLSPSSYIFVR